MKKNKIASCMGCICFKATTNILFTFLCLYSLFSELGQIFFILDSISYFFIRFFYFSDFLITKLLTKRSLNWEQVDMELSAYLNRNSLISRLNLPWKNCCGAQELNSNLPRCKMRCQYCANWINSTKPQWLRNHDLATL